LFVFLANRTWRTLSSNPLGFFALSLLRQDRPTPMTATIKKLHQGLDNVDFIGPENISHLAKKHRGSPDRRSVSGKCRVKSPGSPVQRTSGTRTRHFVELGIYSVWCGEPYLGMPYRLQSSKLTSSTLTSFSPASPPNGAETLFCKIWSISLRTVAASRLVLVAHFDATRSS
jgi:hypothetical protein